MHAPKTLYSLMMAAFCALAGPGLAGDYFNGEKIYQRHCETCHGTDGEGLVAGAPDFSRGEGLMAPEMALFETIADPGDSMHGFKNLIENDEIFDAITYVRSLER